jgi:hypothetical protein
VSLLDLGLRQGRWPHDGPVGPEWMFKGLSDLNGDGKADLVFRRADGTYSGYLMDGFITGRVGPDWTLVGLGDVSGDRKADLISRRPDGSLVEVQYDGLTIIGAHTLGTIGTKWTGCLDGGVE